MARCLPAVSALEHQKQFLGSPARVRLTRLQDRVDKLLGGRQRAALRSSTLLLKSFISVSLETIEPLVAGLARNPVLLAQWGDPHAWLPGLLHEFHLQAHLSVLLPGHLLVWHLSAMS